MALEHPAAFGRLFSWLRQVTDQRGGVNILIGVFRDLETCGSLRRLDAAALIAFLTELEKNVTLRPWQILTLSLPVVATLASAASPAEATAPAPEPEWVQGARQTASAVPPKLLAVLTAAIEKSGPAEAINVCKEKAPQMARAASEQSGWQVRRVSLKNRNPKAEPDVWERQALEQFDRMQAQGAEPAIMERWEQVADNGVQVRRYIKALPTAQLCIQCHGATDKMSADVNERLSQLYPNDKGTGFSVGQIRGAITLRQPVSQP